MTSQTEPTLNDMRAALQACVEIAEQERLLPELVQDARLGLEFLRYLEASSTSRDDAMAHCRRYIVARLLSKIEPDAKRLTQ